MSRGRKLLIVGVVLAIGFGLAWPFRKKVDEKKYESVATAEPAAPPSLEAASSTLTQPSQPASIGSPERHVAAKMMSLGDRNKSTHSQSTTATFDLANHPALAASMTPRSESPVTPPVPPANQLSMLEQRVLTPSVEAPPSSTVPSSPKAPKLPSGPRPAYSTVERDQVFDASEQRPREIRHVVQNSDTLEKLAKRYLGDEGRALEIFDLNRDVLDNPHLLPINAELRIPADAKVNLD